MADANVAAIAATDVATQADAIARGTATIHPATRPLMPHAVRFDWAPKTSRWVWGVGVDRGTEDEDSAWCQDACHLARRSDGVGYVLQRVDADDRFCDGVGQG